MPSLVSIQILSGIICFFCTTYLIISIFYPISFKNIIDELNFQNRQKFVSIITNNTKINLTPLQNTLIRTTNLGTQSFICDAVKTDNQHNKSNASSFETHRLNALRRKYSSFC
jgi:hypothetical protein